MHITAKSVVLIVLILTFVHDRLSSIYKPGLVAADFYDASANASEINPNTGLPYGFFHHAIPGRMPCQDCNSNRQLGSSTFFVQWCPVLQVRILISLQPVALRLPPFPPSSLAVDAPLRTMCPTSPTAWEKRLATMMSTRCRLPGWLPAAGFKLPDQAEGGGHAAVHQVWGPAQPQSDRHHAAAGNFAAALKATNVIDPSAPCCEPIRTCLFSKWWGQLQATRAR